MNDELGKVELKQISSFIVSALLSHDERDLLDRLATNKNEIQESLKHTIPFPSTCHHLLKNKEKIDYLIKKGLNRFECAGNIVSNLI